MTFLKQTLTLSTVGASLITSNSFWFFDFFGISPIQDNSVMELTGDSTPNPAPTIQPSSKKSTDNINKFTSAPRHPSITGRTIKNANLKIVVDSYIGFGVDIVLDDLEENKNKYISKITSETLGDFTLTLFTATEEKYKNFSKDQINISLFKNPAWYSSTGEDEYSKVSDRDEINKLFENKDEVKVKQLLLSLHKRLDWKKFESGPDQQNKFFSKLVYTRGLEDLKDLKIKYFKNFTDLKNYVHTKLEMCTGEEIACIANKDELNVMDTDQPSFFEELEKKKAIGGS